MSADRECDQVSVVVPVYKCGDCAAELCRRLLTVAESLGVRMEIVLVNDGCPQGSWGTIQRLARHDERIKGINLFRNFGQHIAISAGLRYAGGDWVVVMDGDLQDVPEELPKLYAKAQEGYDAVFGRRTNRQDGAIKRMASWAFNSLLSLLSGTRHDSTVANYSIVSRSVVDAVNLLPDQHRSYGLLVYWLRPKTALVDLTHAKRNIGASSYTFWRQVQLALDLVASYSSRPLVFSVATGFCASGLAVVYVAYLLVRKFVYGYGVEGWASTIVSVWFLGGLILSHLGILGLYLGKVFDQSKGRPLYIIRETTQPEGPASQAVDLHARQAVAP